MKQKEYNTVTYSTNTIRIQYDYEEKIKKKKLRHDTTHGKS